jgi:outer membrane protein assembly factor BamB
MPADFANPAVNYAKLKAPPIWFTYFPGVGVNAAPQTFTALNTLSFNRTHHEHSTPVVFQSPNHGTMLFCWGENGNLRAWTIDATGVAKYLGCSSEVASPQSPVPPGGMPGGMMCLSSNGGAPSSAILWACVPLQNANTMVSQGNLYAYDATNLGTYSDGSGAITRIWQSPQYTYNKFNVPVIAGGKVYVPTYDGKVDVYGLNP